MPAAITDLLDRVSDSTTSRPVISSLSAPKALAAASVSITDATGWTTTTAIHLSIYLTKTVAGETIKDTATQTDWKGVLSGTTISNLTLTGGTDRTYVAGALVEITPTSRYGKDLYELLTTLFNQDATLKPAPIQTALGLGAGSLNGWNALGYAPNTVTALGNRSYSMVFNGVDLTGTVSNGMRLRNTRTVTAPTQCTSLNGTTQYYSKAAPNKLTFTNNFVASAWVKLSSYPSSGAGRGTWASRYNGTSGFVFDITSNGQVEVTGFNAGSSNYANSQSYQSIPLNKWVHIAVQMDMTTTLTGTTNNYIMIDGVEVPNVVVRSGTNPTSIVQAGNLEIGAENGGTKFFPGKIAQVAIYNAKVTQATILASMNQTLSGSETSLASAYSFSNSIVDLNVTTPNDLTANGSAVATNADTPFGLDDNNTAGTYEFCIVTKKVFSTNTTLTVQVPEGNTLPTTGGISAVSYSSFKAPYGFPAQRGRWQVEALYRARLSAAGTAFIFQNLGHSLNTPIGEWMGSYSGLTVVTHAGTFFLGVYLTLSTANNTQSDPFKTCYSGAISPSNAELDATCQMSNMAITASAATTYYLNIAPSISSTTVYIGDSSTVNQGSFIRLENAYL